MQAMSLGYDNLCSNKETYCTWTFYIISFPVGSLLKRLLEMKHPHKEIIGAFKKFVNSCNLAVYWNLAHMSSPVWYYAFNCMDSLSCDFKLQDPEHQNTSNFKLHIWYLWMLIFTFYVTKRDKESPLFSKRLLWVPKETTTWTTLFTKQCFTCSTVKYGHWLKFGSADEKRSNTFKMLESSLITAQCSKPLLFKGQDRFRVMANIDWRW